MLFSFFFRKILYKIPVRYDVQVLQNLVGRGVHVQEDDVLHEVLDEVEKGRYGVHPYLVQCCHERVVLCDTDGVPLLHEKQQGDDALGRLDHAVCRHHAVLEISLLLRDRNQESLGARQDCESYDHRSLPRELLCDLTDSLVAYGPVLGLHVLHRGHGARRDGLLLYLLGPLEL